MHDSSPVRPRETVRCGVGTGVVTCVALQMSIKRARRRLVLQFVSTMVGPTYDWSLRTGDRICRAEVCMSEEGPQDLRSRRDPQRTNVDGILNEYIHCVHCVDLTSFRISLTIPSPIFRHVLGAQASENALFQCSSQGHTTRYRVAESQASASRASAAPFEFLNLTSRSPNSFSNLPPSRSRARALLIIHQADPPALRLLHCERPAFEISPQFDADRSRLPHTLVTLPRSSSLAFHHPQGAPAF